MIYLFSGKCPVPPERGGYSLDNLPPDFDYTINHSTHVFWHIIAGLQRDCVFPFNIRDICEKCPMLGKKFGYCKTCTDDEAILLVSCLNDIGRLGKWIGAKVFLCNIGGQALRKVYNGCKKGVQIHSGIDESLFHAVFSDGIHMSNCVSHRASSYRNGPASQQASVYTSLKSLFDILERPDNLQAMIEEPSFKMVADLSSPNYQPPKSPKELKKEAADRVKSLLASHELPTPDDFSNSIFAHLWNKALEKAEADRLKKAEADRLKKEASDRRALKKAEKEAADRLKKEAADRLKKEASDRRALKKAEKEAADRLKKEASDRRALKKAEKEAADRLKKEESGRSASWEKRFVSVKSL
jgi:hypothetical protein